MYLLELYCTDESRCAAELDTVTVTEPCLSIDTLLDSLFVDDVSELLIGCTASLMCFVLCDLCPGSIGFFACFWFVSKIYSVVKVD